MGVGEHQVRDRLAHAGARDVDHAAEAALAHARDDRLDERHRAEDERRVGRLPLLPREAERVGPAGRPAGVAHQDVDGAERLGHLGHEDRRVVEVGRVVHVRGRAELGRRRLDALARVRGDRDARALRDELGRDAAPDPLRRPRHERDLALQAEIHGRDAKRPPPSSGGRLEARSRARRGRRR